MPTALLIGTPRLSDPPTSLLQLSIFQTSRRNKNCATSVAQNVCQLADFQTKVSIREKQGKWRGCVAMMRRKGSRITLIFCDAKFGLDQTSQKLSRDPYCIKFWHIFFESLLDWNQGVIFHLINDIQYLPMYLVLTHLNMYLLCLLKKCISDFTSLNAVFTLLNEKEI